MRALVAMSGGVDSSVAAALMLEQGYDVIGVTLKQWEGPDGSLPTAGCCTLADAEDARRVAAVLDIPYYVLDHTEGFRRDVVEPFAEAYRAGLTPNPCIECNRKVRFRALLDRVDQLGCDVLVTGHHARVVTDDAGRPRLLKGVDAAKDQSYVLYMLSASDLERVRLPIGDMTKHEVRARAAEWGFRTAGKPESQDICFVGKGDYRDFLADTFADLGTPGPMVDADGTEIGTHRGLAHYTVGQRKGLGVAVGEPRYVTGVDGATNTITIGTRRDLEVGAVTLSDVSFIDGNPPEVANVEVKVRYRSTPARARLEDGGRTVVFEDPVTSVAPGQAAVFYRGDQVLGGGTIVETAT